MAGGEWAVETMGRCAHHRRADSVCIGSTGAEGYRVQVAERTSTRISAPPSRMDRMRLASFAGAAIVALYWVAEFVRHALVFDPHGDFAIFYAAGRAVLAGRTPYANHAFYSPPWVAVWMAPFALLPPELAQIAWSVVSLCLIAASGLLLWRMVGAKRPQAHAVPLALSLLAVALFYPLRQMFDGAQTDAFPLVATALFVYLDSTDRPFLAGLALIPGLFNPHLIIGPCVYAVARLRWKAIAGGFAGGALCTALGVALTGPASISVFLTRLRAAEAYWAVRPLQVTVLHTLLAADVPADAAWVVFSLLVATAVIAGMYTLRHTKGDAIASLAVCAALSEFVIPFGFAQDYTLMLLALPWVARCLQSGRTPVAGWVAFSVSAYFGGLSWIRYPMSHDLLHAVVPLCLFPAVWAWREALGMDGRSVALVLALWAASDVLFGIGNPALPLWVDSLAFNLGPAATIVASAATLHTTSTRTAA